MKPTDKMLNEAAAQSCGWQVIDAWDSPRENYPDYCTNRNAHAELWTAILEADKADCAVQQGAKVSRRSSIIGYLIGMRRGGKTIAAEDFWYIHTAPCRNVVIAFLRAMGQWPDTWEEE